MNLPPGLHAAPRGTVAGEDTVAGEPTVVDDLPMDDEPSSGDEQADAVRADAVQADAVQADGRPAWGGSWPLAAFAVPLAIFTLTRIIQIALIAWMLPKTSDSAVRDRLLSWDVGWFVRVARDGYPDGYTYDDQGAIEANGLAFFPGFPSLIRVMHLLTGESFETAALAAGCVAGLAATVGVYALGRELYDHRVGVAFATLFCAQPMSVVLNMGYSEGLFVAFTAAAFVAAHRNAWLVAGLFGLCSALSRPTGAAVALAITIAAGMRLWSLNGTAVAQRWRPVVGAGLSLVGVPGYLLWVGLRAGSLRAWFDIQTAGWGTTFDGGRSAYRFVVTTLRDGGDFVAASVAWMLIAAVVLAVVVTTQRVWPPLLVYGMLSLVLVLGQAGFFHSKPRLMVPVLVILLPMALALGRARLRMAVPALAGYAAFGLWYGSYMITIWHFAI